MYEIEHGIVLTHGRDKYPFKQMEVGDSFFAPVMETTKSKVYYAAKQWEKGNHGQRFKVRLVEDGCRCWRVE